MPLCGATWDENGVPPWTRGDLRGVWEGETNPPRRSATAVAPRHPSEEGISKEFSCRGATFDEKAVPVE